MNVTLSIDLVVPEERLFVLDLAQLRTLEQRMFEQATRESYALNQFGAAYVLNFNGQRKTVDALMRFVQSFPRYQALADGQRMYSWIQANGREVNYGSLIAAFRAIRALDGIQLVEPPTITTQPADQAVMAGEPPVDQARQAFFYPRYHSDSGSRSRLGVRKCWSSSLHGALKRHGSHFDVRAASLDARRFAGRCDVLRAIRRRCDSFPIGCSTGKSAALG